jgi:hypothetical protein
MMMRLEWSSAVKPSQELIDAVMDAYITWREQSAGVDASYRAWGSCPTQQRATAYAEYVAALDREEESAEEYRRLVERTSKR